MSDLGYDDAGAGDPALLFLHGWCGDRSFFAPQFEHFATSDRVVSVDLPGHGISPVPSKYEVWSFASEVADLMRELDLGRSVVFGHGLGAMVALSLAWHEPDLVCGVVKIDPPPLRQEVWRDFEAELVPSFRGRDGRAGRQKFIEQMFLPTDDSKRRAQIIETMMAMPNDVAIPMVQAMARFDAMAVLRVLDVPVMCVFSAVPTNDAADLLDACPWITLGQTVGTGHFLQLEVPEQVNAMIERFLEVAPICALERI
jgi:pimeloyl-ACP methyl ester carboxylesterase